MSEQIPWEIDQTPATDPCRNIEHGRHGHRALIGPSGGDAVCAVFGNFPTEADEESDEISELIVRAVNSHADLKAVAEMAMCPERDATDQYHNWHERLKAAAAAALEGIK